MGIELCQSLSEALSRASLFIAQYQRGVVCTLTVHSLYTYSTVSAQTIYKKWTVNRFQELWHCFSTRANPGSQPKKFVAQNERHKVQLPTTDHRLPTTGAFSYQGMIIPALIVNNKVK